MRLEYYAATVKGKKSVENEDSFALPDYNTKELSYKINLKGKGYFFIVCDGMGGHNSGEVASGLASSWLMKDYYTSSALFSFLPEMIKKTNQKLFELSKKHEQYKNMGTTLVSLLIKGKKALVHNVGDSRCYAYANNKLTQITEDHSEVWELYEKGLIEKDDILTSARKNIITQAIGLKEKPEINSYVVTLPAEYIFLLCSDGVTDVIKDNDLRSIIRNSLNLKDCADKLMETSISNGSKDDITILLVSNYMLKE